MEKEIPLSQVEGLQGGDNDKDANINNWVTISTVLERLSKLRRVYRCQPNIPAEEWFEFGSSDTLYFLRHEHHIFVLLFLASKRTAIIADGGNYYRTNNKLAEEIQNMLQIRLISVPFNGQLAVDHCGSSAILIGVELLIMHERGIMYQNVTVSRFWRARLVKMLHPHKSKPVELPSLGKRREKLICSTCGITFKSNQAKALNMHRYNAHRS